MGLFSKKPKTVKLEHYSGDTSAIENLFREGPLPPEELYDVIFKVFYSYGSDDWQGSSYVFCSGVKDWEIRKICNLDYSSSCDWARTHGVDDHRLDGIIKIHKKYPYKEGKELGFSNAYKGAGL